ncbi:hypothetical protein GOBAR_AA29965 [Gossypium barbadense]|uniref:Uncharacterized protein n=1 Tax=Gossypium barbadense TaxID=3634 RepID=A0A2P5WI04_GOSBA|nr:hypothetical protein GOBAR_AA29965 [Gossypium barbadense]
MLRSFSDSHIDIFVNEDLEEVPWLVIGDFNEKLFSFEKQRALLRSDRQMRAFSSALKDCSLEDLGYKGVCIVFRISRILSLTIARLLWMQRMEFLVVVNGTFGLKWLGYWRILVEEDDVLMELVDVKLAMNLKADKEELIMRERLSNERMRSERLNFISEGLNRWFQRIHQEKRLLMQTLRSQLDHLSPLYPTDDVLMELMDVKLAMNLEANKEELYWELIKQEGLSKERMSTSHKIAKDRLSCDEDRFWVKEAPAVVVAAAAEDCRLLGPP